MEEINIKDIQSSKPISELLEFCVINVDKPAGFTSFDTSEENTGHFGI